MSRQLWKLARRPKVQRISDCTGSIYWCPPWRVLYCLRSAFAGMLACRVVSKFAAHLLLGLIVLYKFLFVPICPFWPLRASATSHASCELCAGFPWCLMLFLVTSSFALSRPRLVSFCNGWMLCLHDRWLQCREKKHFRELLVVVKMFALSKAFSLSHTD